VEDMGEPATGPALTSTSSMCIPVYHLMIDLFHSTLQWKKKQPTCSIWMSKHTMDRLPQERLKQQRRSVWLLWSRLAQSRDHRFKKVKGKASSTIDRLSVVAQISRRWETVRTNFREKRGAFHGHKNPTLSSTFRREALVGHGHAPDGNHLSRCHACGGQSRENPTPHAYAYARRQEIVQASQEREPPVWSHAHGSRVSRTTVSSWITKKELSFRLCRPPCSPRTQRILRP
jgi:hypothetical protein